MNHDSNVPCLHSPLLTAALVVLLSGISLADDPRSALVIIRHAACTPGGQSSMGTKCNSSASEVFHPDGSLFATLGIKTKDTIDFHLRPWRDVTFRLEHINPLLYDYQVGDIVTTNTEDYAALLEFIKSLGSLGTSFAKVETAAAPLRGAPVEITFPDAVANISGAYEKIPGWTSDSYADPNMIKQKVDEEWGQIPDSMQRIREDLKIFRACAGSIIQTNVTGPEANTDHPSRKATAAIDPGTKAPAANAEDSEDPCVKAGASREIITFALILEPDLVETMDLLEAFKKDVDELDTSRDIKTLDYSTSEKQTFTLTISRNANWPESLDQKGDLRKTGDIELSVEPYSPVSLSVAGAVVYSFVRDPEFSAEKQEDGTFLIRKSQSDYKATQVAAMLELTPRALEFPLFSIPVELGITPTDKLGIYLGAGIRSQGRFSFGGGLAFQQVDQLVDGLAVNQGIESEDKLKTEKVFKTGLYLHITVSLSP